MSSLDRERLTAAEAANVKKLIFIASSFQSPGAPGHLDCCLLSGLCSPWWQCPACEHWEKRAGTKMSSYCRSLAYPCAMLHTWIGTTVCNLSGHKIMIWYILLFDHLSFIRLKITTAVYNSWFMIRSWFLETKVATKAAKIDFAFFDSACAAMLQACSFAAGQVRHLSKDAAPHTIHDMN